MSLPPPRTLLTRTLFARALARARWHRRPIAVALVAFAVLLLVRDLRPAPAPGVEVLVAARDLAAGSELTDSDLVPRRVAAADVPDGALTLAPVGRVVALPVRRGEIVTDVRMLTGGLLEALAPRDDLEVVAAPVHLADAATAPLLRAGDTVDVLGAGPGGGAVVAARRATVLVAPSRRTSDAFASAASDGNGVVVLAVSADEALDLARAAATERLSVVVRPG